MSRKSIHVCARCGVPCLTVGAGSGSVWKHANSGTSGFRSCGQPPVPITQEKWDMRPSLGWWRAQVRRIEAELKLLTEEHIP